LWNDGTLEFSAPTGNILNFPDYVNNRGSGYIKMMGSGSITRYNTLYNTHPLNRLLLATNGATVQVIGNPAWVSGVTVFGGTVSAGLRIYNSNEVSSVQSGSVISYVTLVPSTTNLHSLYLTNLLFNGSYNSCEISGNFRMMDELKTAGTTYWEVNSGYSLELVGSGTFTSATWLVSGTLVATNQNGLVFSANVNHLLQGAVNSGAVFRASIATIHGSFVASPFSTTVMNTALVRMASGVSGTLAASGASIGTLLVDNVGTLGFAAALGSGVLAVTNGTLNTLGYTTTTGLATNAGTVNLSNSTFVVTNSIVGNYNVATSTIVLRGATSTVSNYYNLSLDTGGTTNSIGTNNVTIQRQFVAVGTPGSRVGASIGGVLNIQSNAQNYVAFTDWTGGSVSNRPVSGYSVWSSNSATGIRQPGRYQTGGL
jgi:hypothetical protein